MKKSNSNQTSGKAWTHAVFGAILAGSVAGALSRGGALSKKRFQTLLLARKWFVFTIVFLVVCVLITSILLVGQLEQYFYHKEHDLDINLLSEPGFDMDDGSGNLMFSTESEQQLFQAFYASADGSDFSVQSATGAPVVAPGTQGEYTFRINNPDDFDVFYSVTLDGLFSIEGTDHLIPIVVRMKGHDGEYLIGSDYHWEKISKLKSISDAGTLKGKSSRYYTLEWTWPYESDNDELDTMLGMGNFSLGDASTLKPNEVLEFTLQVETNAMLPVQDRAPFTVFFQRALPVLLIVTVILLLGALAAVIRYRCVHKKTMQ